LADFVDVDRTPWVGLVLAVALTHLPLLVHSALSRQRVARLVLSDAAVTLGASTQRARSVLHGGWFGVASSGLILTLILSVTNVTPALLLAPTAETRPIGPALLTLVDETSEHYAHAAALAMIAISANFAALVLATRHSRSVLGEWIHD
jgi:ABC-type Fe3+ transport system permease subunit